MESIADLIPLAIVAGYWLLRTLRGGQTRRPAPAQPTSEPSAPTPFEQLMRQLEEALEEPREPTPEPVSDEAEREVEPARPVLRQAERAPAPRAVPRPPRAVPSSFETPSRFEEAFDHERHGFGAENPMSEEAFEARPAFAPRRAKAKASYDPHALRSGRNPAKQKPRRGASAWATRLHDPAAAREALVLKTIFEGPWTPRSGRKQR